VEGSGTGGGWAKSPDEGPPVARLSAGPTFAAVASADLESEDFDLCSGVV